MAEKLEKINLFGQEFELTSRGAAGGSGGGGMGITGGAYVPAEGGITTTNRWLRFDFDNPSHKALKILAGTTFSMGETIIPFDEDTSVNLSDYISEPGADYYVFVNADKRVVCSTLRTQPDGYMFIGQFHTLCADVGDNVTGITSIGEVVKQVGDTVTLQNYFKERDLDFYNFYTKEIRSMNNGSYYNIATIDHPLSGFKAGDILPESVWCLNWHPVSKNWDGMVWCNGADFCVDIYLTTGSGLETRSEYGSVYRQPDSGENYIWSGSIIGKKTMCFEDFIICSDGSNQLTQAASNYSTAGGHVDTSNRRMISFIGCEDCTGLRIQYCNNSASYAEGGSDYYWIIDDGRGLLGRSADVISTLSYGFPYGAYYPSINAGTRTNFSKLGFQIYDGVSCRYKCNVTIV